MAGLGDILKMLPIDDIAKQLGVDSETASQAVQEGSATILTGLAKNAATPDGASAIEKALSKHAGQGDAVDPAKVDAADGGKILKHIFGDDEKKVTQELNNSDKTASGIDFGKLLPVLAPIIMGMLAKNNAKPADAQAEGQGGGITDIIGGLLGGGGGGGITDILGGLLGGGGNNGGGLGGGLQNILGGLFGGKK